MDLQARAYQAMLEYGFEPTPSDAVRREVSALLERQADSDPPPEEVLDLRHLPWSSIDNDDSRDLDQVEAAELLPEGYLRVRVGIADVDALVPKGSAIDAHAFANTTSVYLGVRTFPMLPDELSSDLTSLVEGQDRLAVVIETIVGPDGTVPASDVYRARVRNHAKLVYESVGDWLEGKAGPPEALERVPGLEDQLRLQNEAAERLRGLRCARGALDLETLEPRPVVEDGRVVDLTLPPRNAARLLIEDLMVAANTAMAQLLERRGLSTLQRIVRSPRRWSRIVALAHEYGSRLPPTPKAKRLATFLEARRKADPERFPDLSLAVVKLLGPGEYEVLRPGEDPTGHFGLAARDYTHSTAPNRRYVDLINQRLLKSVIAEAPPPYTDAELERIAGHCTERESASRKVERHMRKVAAVLLLEDRIGQVFFGLVTGASPKGTYVRVLDPPVEGRVVRGEEGLDVGDHVRVRLIDTDVDRGYIDFERVV